MSVDSFAGLVVAAISRQDVAAVEALEPQVRAFADAIRAAQPALDRLREAGYPGAGGVRASTLDLFGEGGSSADLREVVRDLQEFRIGGGNQAAYDYQQYCARGQTVAEAAMDILESNFGEGDDLARIEGLRRYASGLGGVA